MKELIREAMARADMQAQAASRVNKDFAPRGKAAGEEFAHVMDSLTTRIKVIGCGGCGANTIQRIAEDEFEGIELVALNTDAQHLLGIQAPKKVLIGKRLTRGLGAGSLPQVGEEAAMESQDEVRKALEGADLVFITAGLGGGTGTGSAPVVAKIAKDLGALTIAVCTLPFTVEGRIRMENAEAGLARLRDVCDTVIVIPNDKLLELAPRLPLNAAFKVADEVLMRSIKGITEMVTKPGLVNLDFADLKTIMKGGGVAMIGLGESDAEDRAVAATLEAINSPLLDVDVSDATGALINVVGGPDMTIGEAERVVEEIYNRINADARIIWGTTIDPGLERAMRVMVVITGVKSKQILGPSRHKQLAKRAEYGIDFVL